MAVSVTPTNALSLHSTSQTKLSLKELYHRGLISKDQATDLGKLPPVKRGQEIRRINKIYASNK